MKFYGVFWTGASVREDGGFFGIFSTEKKAKNAIKLLGGQTDNPGLGSHYKIVPIKVDSKSRVRKTLKEKAQG